MACSPHAVAKCCLTTSLANGSGDGDYDGDGVVATDADYIIQYLRHTTGHHSDPIFQLANEGLQQRLQEPQDGNPGSIQALFRFLCTVPTPSLRSDCCIRFEQAAAHLWLQDDPSEAGGEGPNEATETMMKGMLSSWGWRTMVTLSEDVRNQCRLALFNFSPRLERVGLA